MIAVIDYGMGNLRSVEKALEVSGAKALVTDRPGDILRSEKIVFPGVGAFGAAMKELKRRGLVDAIKSGIESGKPFLGLCLGLQLLFENSEEAPGVKGLAVLKGDVKRFRFSRNMHKGKKGDKRGATSGLKIPHMGWNTICRSKSSGSDRNDILRGIPNGSYMYFVHSYYVKPKERSVCYTSTEYGIDFVSGVRRDNIYGFQFHPEKSQSVGLKVLQNFIKL